MWNPTTIAAVSKAYDIYARTRPDYIEAEKNAEDRKHARENALELQRAKMAHEEEMERRRIQHERDLLKRKLKHERWMRKHQLKESKNKQYSNHMIVFDQETRQFSVVEQRDFAIDWKKVGEDATNAIGRGAHMAARHAQVASGKAMAGIRGSSNNTAGLVVGAGNALLTKHKRAQLEKQYMNQGKDPEEAKKLARKATGSTGGAFLKGYAGGYVGRAALRKMGVEKTARDYNRDARKIKAQTKAQVASIQAQNKVKEAQKAQKEAVKLAKKG